MKWIFKNRFFCLAKYVRKRQPIFAITMFMVAHHSSVQGRGQEEREGNDRRVKMPPSQTVTPSAAYHKVWHFPVQQCVFYGSCSVAHVPPPSCQIMATPLNTSQLLKRGSCINKFKEKPTKYCSKNIKSLLDQAVLTRGRMLNHHRSCSPVAQTAVEMTPRLWYQPHWGLLVWVAHRRFCTDWSVNKHINV